MMFCALAMLVRGAAAQHAINGQVPGMVNSGTPGGVPAHYDCAVREHAWEFGKATLPSRGDFKSLFDALQLQHCNVSAPHPTTMDVWKPPSYPTPTTGALFVAPGAPAGGNGTKAKPFATLAQAVSAAAGKGKVTILLRAGVHYSGQLLISAAHAGITFQNYQGEHAIVSGGVPIQAAKADWKPYKVAPAAEASVVAKPPSPPVPLPTGWTDEPGSNNVFGRAKPGASSEDMVFLGHFTEWGPCVAAMVSQNSSHGPFNSITWHQPGYSGRKASWDGDCYGMTGTEWAPRHDHMLIHSAKGPHAVPSPPPGPPGPAPRPPPPPPPPANIWELDLSQLTASASAMSIAGLRLDGTRAIRAKYPNGNPELSGPNAMEVQTYQAGWVDAHTEWILPEDKWKETEDDVANDADWPGVNWPMVVESKPGSSSTNDTSNSSVALGVKGPDPGACGDYHIGHGGFCDDLHDPSSGPTGYWCSHNPPRGQCYDPDKRSSRGCTQTHMSPDGLKYTDAILPHAKNYTNIKGAVVQAWRCVRWFTNLCLVESMNKETGEIIFDKKAGGGCNQGGEGCVRFAQWWIENVFEELDEVGEWYFNETSQKLFYFFNNSAPPTGNEKFIATKTKVLWNISGSQAAPVNDVTIRGLEIRDTAYTYLGTDKADLHGMPSGGDWALQRSGAILLEGTERASVTGNLITRVDGNGIFLSNYNRNTTIDSNEMSWIGDGAIAAWGSTSKCLNANCSKKLPWGVGPDARGGDQPRGTHIVGNLVREIGIWQKQSSFWFQATTMQTHIERNVHFNGPRAGLNFNDGMGGSDIIEGNLLTNCVRESGDHGPWNSWDRVPYITTEGMIRDDSLPPTGPGLPGHKDAKGKPSIVPKFREIRKNFIIGVYNSQEDIDTDDGSSYYQTHDNYFAMANHGLKSDFDGQWNHHWNNIYGYVGSCYNEGPWLAFYNNTCITTGGGFSCPKTDTMSVYGNKVFTAPGKKGSACNGSVGVWPSDETIEAQANAMLAPFPMAVPPQPGL